MGENKAFVRRNQSGGWKVTNRLSYAVGEKSIDFPRILCRLFLDTSVHPLGHLGTNELIVWENRSVPIVPPPRLLGRKEYERTWVA